MADALLYQPLTQYIETLPHEFSQLSDERKAMLQEIGAYIRQKRQGDKAAKILIICTHNSRRSHMGQLWLQAAATYYHIKKIKAFSGGTEATAFHPHAIAAMEKAGFRIKVKEPGKNPVYEATLSPERPPMLMWSKRFNEPPNPASGFCAIMVCTAADQACPWVHGAEKRFVLPFEDPKNADGTPAEKFQYDACCRQIAVAMLYIMHSVKQR